MPGKLNLYDFGGGGVNRVKNPLQLADNELTSAQNAEYVADGNPGGQGALNKRGGIQALTSALNSGASILGMIGLPLQTTYVRTLYASLGTETGGETWVKTTDGTSWTVTGTPLLCRTGLFGGDVSDAADVGYLQKVTKRIAQIGTQLVYPGHVTVGSANPTIVRFAGTAESAVTVFTVPPGPVSSTGFADIVVDMLVANNTIYMSVSDPGGTAGNMRGYVISVDIETGAVAQVGEQFGSTGLTGGGPTALIWYQGKLWTGTGDGSSPSGRIAFITPGVDTNWTTDVASAGESICSMAVYKGDLYVGFEGDAGVSSIKKRTASTGSYANSLTGGSTGSAHFGCLIVYNDELYAVEYFSTASDVLHIKKFDGSSWTTDADLDASFSGVYPGTGDPFWPGVSMIYGSDLYISFLSRGETGGEASYTDGFIMRKSGGTWTKVYTGNVQGPMAVLLERS